MADNAGRWTNEEHDRFMQGLDAYGKKWTKVAEVVGSRSTVQVRSHAQKYFQKMIKSGGLMTGGDGGSFFGSPGMPGAGIPSPYKHACRNPDQHSGKRGRALPVPPSLQPFAAPGSNDLVSSLYTFLSPELVPTGQAVVPPSLALAEASLLHSKPLEVERDVDDDGCEVERDLTVETSPVSYFRILMESSSDRDAKGRVADQRSNEQLTDMSIAPRQATTPLHDRPMQELSSAEIAPPLLPQQLGTTGVVATTQIGPQGDPAASSMAADKCPEHVCSVPEWFQRGQTVAILLEAAEGLDWTSDSGARPHDYRCGGSCVAAGASVVRERRITSASNTRTSCYSSNSDHSDEGHRNASSIARPYVLAVSLKPPSRSSTLLAPAPPASSSSSAVANVVSAASGRLVPCSNKITLSRSRSEPSGGGGEAAQSKGAAPPRRTLLLNEGSRSGSRTQTTTSSDRLVTTVVVGAKVGKKGSARLGRIVYGEPDGKRVTSKRVESRYPDISAQPKVSTPSSKWPQVMEAKLKATLLKRRRADQVDLDAEAFNAIEVDDTVLDALLLEGETFDSSASRLR